MKKIKHLGFVLALLVVLLVLVLVRTTNKNHFTQEAQLAIAASTKGKNLLTFSQLEELKGNSLFIAFDSVEKLKTQGIEPVVEILPEDILQKENRKLLDNAGGKIILFSEDLPTLAKTWVTLNQLGYKNLFVLTDDENIEAFTYKFQPDTTARLE